MDIRIFNADDHPMLRKGITDLLVETEGIQWVGSAADGKEAIEKLRVIQPDVAFLDIEMPHYSGLEVARTLIDEGSKTNFVLFTLFKDANFLQNAIKIGVKGYLLKDSSETEIIKCIHSVAKGIPFVNASMTQYLIQSKSGENNILSNLSSHEVNILKLIAKQKTTAEIASMLFISPKTVGNHRSNISKKLELTGEQNGLLKWAIEHRDLLS